MIGFFERGAGVMTLPKMKFINSIIFIFSCDALSEEFYSAPFEDLKVPGQPEIVFNCVDAASKLLF